MTGVWVGYCEHQCVCVCANKLTVKTSSSPSSPSFWSAVEEVVEPAGRKMAITQLCACEGQHKDATQEDGGTAYLRPGPRWLCARPCRMLWRRLDSERTDRTSGPPPSSGERWGLLWCTRGPSSADSPRSPVHITRQQPGLANFNAELALTRLSAFLPACLVSARPG